MKLRVLHLSSEKTWRGGEQQIAYLVEEHKQKGIDVHIMCRKGSDFAAYCHKRNWKVSYATFSNSLDVVSAIKLKKYCKENDIDLIHLHTSKAHGVGVLAAALGNTAKLVLSRRVAFGKKSGWLTHWKYNHPAIRRVVCISQHVKSEMEHICDFTQNLRVVYDGVKLPEDGLFQKKTLFKEKYSLSPDTKLVANIAALTYEKDYKTYIAAAEQIIKSGRKDTVFLCVGEGSLKEELMAELKEKGLEDYIKFTGFVKGIQDYLSELDVVVMTSKNEGLGTSLLDAMARKVPVVATAAGGIPEVVIHEKTGLLAGVGNVEEVAANISRILDDKLLTERMVENARDRLKMFDKESTASKMLEVYEELI